MVSIWKEIDSRIPNPMKHPEDITIYKEISQRNKLYQFLSGINETYDKDRRDILNKTPLPTVEEAYASIRREISRREILNPSSGQEPLGIGSGLIIKHNSLDENKPSQGFNNPSEISGEYITKSRLHRGPVRRDEGNKTHLHCTHCGGSKHTKEGCFHIIGFPDW